jgi:hypothetical protein
MSAREGDRAVSYAPPAPLPMLPTYWFRSPGSRIAHVATKRVTGEWWTACGRLVRPSWLTTTDDDPHEERCLVCRKAHGDV